MSNPDLMPENQETPRQYIEKALLRHEEALRRFTRVTIAKYGIAQTHARAAINEHAEDVLQNTRLTALEICHKYDARFDHSDGLEWLKRIAHNHILRLRKTENKYVPLRDSPLSQSDEKRSELDILDAIRQPSVIPEPFSFEEILKSVPAAYHDVLRLRYKEDLGGKEIAEKLNIKHAAVLQRLSRGEKLLRAAYQQWQKQQQAA